MCGSYVSPDEASIEREFTLVRTEWQFPSLKVKRLFLCLGSRYQYPWFEKLDRSANDLGKGKRLIVRGGRCNREFRITVPERFDAER
jgi:hypothetical protein